MSKAIALLCLTMTIAGCGTSTASGKPPVGDAATGSRLFVQEKCVTCHIVNGIGGNKAPELTQNPIATDFNQLRAWLADPPAQMQYVKKLHLTDKQIANISAFTGSKLKPAQGNP